MIFVQLVKIFRSLTEHEGQLPRSQEPAIGWSLPEPDERILVSLISIPILPSHLCLGFTVVLFLHGFRQTVRISHFHAYLISFDWITAVILKNISAPVTEAARSKAQNVFVRSNTGIVGSNPTQGMDVCPDFSRVCVLLCR
jgi:hypothetical protein